MQEMVMMEGYESIIETVLSTRTPMSVLDRNLTNSESDNNRSTTTNTRDGAIGVAEKREIKRRKLSGLCSSKSRFQLSQRSNQWWLIDVELDKEAGPSVMARIVVLPAISNLAEVSVW